MAMATERRAVILALALVLSWPALWNGYPIVFADTGTYLSQAIHRYLGWDRPPFYSLFMLPLHLRLTTWPVVAAQALLAAWMLALLWRVLAPGAPFRRLLVLAPALAILTWLPWLVSELMPDLFTPLLILGFGLLAWCGSALSPLERHALVIATAGMIATQLSSLPLWIGLAVPVLAWRLCRPWLVGSVGASPARPLASGRTGPALVLARHGLDDPRLLAPDRSWRGIGVLRLPGGGGAVTGLLIPPALALLGLCVVNLAGHGRFHPSPYGDVFLLARLLADGPARETLGAHCPAAGWRLCAAAGLPTDSDVFLWADDSPVVAAGGHKAIGAEASAIVALTLRERPAAALATSTVATLRQLAMTRSGDGLEPWPKQVTPWIERDFPPAEAERYRAARQQAGALGVASWMQTAHQVTILVGIALAPVLAFVWRHRRPLAARLLLLSVLVLPLSAAITGALSGPHDRYQARIAFLPALVCAFACCARPPRAEAPDGRAAP